jgi:hypothetical protein
MPVTTWWGIVTTAIVVLGGAILFVRRIVYGDVKSLRDFRRLALGTAAFAAILVLFSAIPIDQIFPCQDANIQCNLPWRDAAIVANAIGPLFLSVSVTLASIFYSAGEWYETAQRFRMLGVRDARPDRKGRQSERATHWQDVLRGTKRRFVISGITLGGWFVNGWEETRESLLAVLPKAKVQVLLAAPKSSGFIVRADDPSEATEAQKTERARPRAKRVYERIEKILGDAAFKEHLNSNQLSFYVYEVTPLSVVWADDDIYFTSYLPFTSDSACPEFTIDRKGTMGGTIAASIDDLVNHAKKITTAEDASRLAAACEESE